MIHPEIAIVGGGVFVPQLCKALVSQPGFDGGEIRLAARRFDRLQTIAGQCSRMLADTSPSWTIRACPTLAEALAEADAIILLIRVGGLAARARDESFPRAFGLNGDEGLGPGGMANALRTVPVMLEMTEVIARIAPHATVFNMVAPLGVTTRTLLAGGLDAIGVCELPAVTEEKLRAKLPEEFPLLQYAGFNHLGWFWSEGQHISALLESARTAGLADGTTLERYGAVPLRYVLEMFAPDAAADLGFSRSPDRARELHDLSEQAIESFQAGAATDDLLSGRPTPWFDLACAPMVVACLGDGTFHGFANVANDGVLPLIGDDNVVELRCRIAQGKRKMIAPTEMPADVSRFLAAVGRSEDLIYRAALSRDLSLIEQALAELPLPPFDGSVQELAAGIGESAAMAEMAW